MPDPVFPIIVEIPDPYGMTTFEIISTVSHALEEHYPRGEAIDFASRADLCATRDELLALVHATVRVI